MRESASNGARLAHSTASSIEFTWRIQYPAVSFFDSSNGPVMTARLPPENLTRRPSALGSSPARSTSAPACLRSSLYLPIAASSSSLGTAPGSGSPLIINITRMSCVLSAYAGTSVLCHFHELNDRQKYGCDEYPEQRESFLRASRGRGHARPLLRQNPGRISIIHRAIPSVTGG